MAVSVSFYIKDPNAIRDYAFNWSLDAGDTITVSTWTPPAGITAVSNSFTTSPSPHRTVVRLSGGTSGVTHVVVHDITTAQGKKERAYLVIICQEEWK